MNTKIISNLYKDVLNKFRSLIDNKYKQLGISWADLKRIRSLPENQLNSMQFMESEFYFKGSHEFLHAVDEIYLQELYKIKFNRPDPVILDCGAHIGVSVLYFKQHYPGCNVIAFEPDKRNFDILSKNVASYSLKNVILKNEAVWIEDTELSFAGDGSMSSKIDMANTSADHALTKATRLKNLLETRIDFLKIDIEGAEYVVLKDIADNLKNVVNLFVEYHGSFNQNKELNEIFDIIVNAGFSFYIKEANPSHQTPFDRSDESPVYDLQLNIFCFRKN